MNAFRVAKPPETGSMGMKVASMIPAMAAMPAPVAKDHRYTRSISIPTSAADSLFWNVARTAFPRRV